MKLAELLIERADLQKRFKELSTRIETNAEIQEGDAPPEDPNSLLKEVTGVSQTLEAVIVRINEANNQIVVPLHGTTLMQKLAARDRLAMMRNLYKTLSGLKAEDPYRRYRSSRNEIKNVSTVDMKAMRQEYDRLAKAHRELDTEIQALNWSIEV